MSTFAKSIEGSAGADRKLSEAQSLDAVTKLIKVSIDCVSYGRGLFPKEMFVFREVQGYLGPRLRAGHRRDGESYTSASTLEAWIFKGVHEAIGKRYLKSAAFIVIDAEDQPLETYTYRLKYPSSESFGVEADTFTPDGSERRTLGDMRAELVHVMDSVRFLTSALPSLSSAATHFTMKLSYNSLAPPDYTPPHFRACASEELDFRVRAARALKISDLRTSFHSLALLFKGPDPISQEAETGESIRASQPASTSESICVSQEDLDEARDDEDDLIDSSEETCLPDSMPPPLPRGHLRKNKRSRKDDSIVDSGAQSFRVSTQESTSEKPRYARTKDPIGIAPRH